MHRGRGQAMSVGLCFVAQGKAHGCAMPTARTGTGRGAKSQPIELQRARGNPNHKKLPPAPMPDSPNAVVVYAGDIPPTPEWCDEHGARLWVQLWNAGSRYLSKGHDLLMMELLVEKLQTSQLLRAWLGTDVRNRWYTTANGQTVSHPAVKQLENADGQITAWLVLLGFPVSERARLGLFEVRVADELDSYRQRSDARAAKDGKK